MDVRRGRGRLVLSTHYIHYIVRQNPKDCVHYFLPDTALQTMKREHKAARTLGIIMGVFILCKEIIQYITYILQ